MIAGYYYLDISPDDKTLAFHGYDEPADSNGIYFVDLTNEQALPLRFSCSNNCGYRDRDFAFSPNGKNLAVTRRVNRFNENIFLVNIATKQAEQLTFGEEDIVGLTWNATGDKLVFGSQRSDVRRGYILDITTKKVSDLAINGFSYPAFSKQSNELFFQQRSEKYHLASLSLQSEVTSSPFPVIESEFSHQYPHYSEKINKLVYVSNESGFYELWISDSNGQNRQQLTFLKQTVRYPRWSHKGDKIAFLAPIELNKSDKIYIYNITNQSLSVIPTTHKEHNRPTWSWDDSAIISAVYEDEYTDLHLIDIKTGISKRISFQGSRYGVMISPSTLLFTASQKGLWQKEISPDHVIHNKPFQKISESIFKSTYSWEYVDDGVYFAQSLTKHHLISFYDMKEEKLIPLLKLPKYTLASGTPLTYIKPNQELLFTQAESPQADIKKNCSPVAPIMKFCHFQKE